MAGLAEGRPEAVTTPAGPPALPGPHLQDTVVVTDTVQMSHEWWHFMGTETHELNVTHDFFPPSGKANVPLDKLSGLYYGGHLRRELPGATKSTTTSLTLKAVWESWSS